MFTNSIKRLAYNKGTKRVNGIFEAAYLMIEG